MGNVAVLVKAVPDTWTNKTFRNEKLVLDRETADLILDEINERAVEAAVQLKEAGKVEQVILISVGPQAAENAMRRGLSLGADSVIQITDERIVGSDAIQTGWILARAISTLTDIDLILAGNKSTDGQSGMVPAIVAEYLGLPQVSNVQSLTVKEQVATVAQESSVGVYNLETSLPAVISVSEKINEPRYPTFKGIMAAKQKKVSFLSLEDIGVEPGEVGLANAGEKVIKIAKMAPKITGEKVVGDDIAVEKIMQLLVQLKLI